MSEHRENRAFRLKMQLAFAVWKRRDLSHAMRLVFTVLLLGHHNVLTGKCNPSYETLASECGMTRHGVIRIIGKLEAIGLLAIVASVGRKHTNSFSFPLLKMVAGGREMVAGQPRNGGRGATQNIKEHKEHRGEASPAPLKHVSASPKKENGQQGKITQLREISDKAKAMLASIPMKRLPFEPERWKAGDPDPEPSAEEQRAMMQIVNGAEVKPMNAKPKPAPIILEPSRIESPAIFFNAIREPETTA